MRDENDSDMQTIAKIRIPSSTPRVVKDLAVVFLLLLGFAFGIFIFGAFQYWGCYLKDERITVIQCLRNDYPKVKK